jgi:hypothetical protein
MKTPCLIALTSALLCQGCVNHPADVIIPFKASDSADAVRKIGGVVEAAGLSPIPIKGDPFDNYAGRPFEIIAEWKWPSRTSFFVSVIKWLPPDEGYSAAIGDSQEEGFTFRGVDCQKYLEIDAALKALPGFETPRASSCGKYP